MSMGEWLWPSLRTLWHNEKRLIVTPFQVIAAVLLLLSELLQAIKPILVPLCFIFAWLFILALGSTLWSSLRDVTHRAKEMHKIPCATCQFFTNDHRLKCTVQPTIANTEQAINCGDYAEKKY